MGILDDLLGGSTPRRQDYQDFIERYQQSTPHDTISDTEAVQRYQEVAQHLPPAEYQQSAEQAFARLTPDQRAEFGTWLTQQAAQQGVAPSGDTQPSDPRQLAQIATQLHQQQPGLLGGLLGNLLGGGGGSANRAGSMAGGSGGIDALLSSPIAKAALAGITAMAAQRIMRGQR